MARAARLVFSAMIVALSSGRLSAQIPDRFTNLRVLPDTISRAELVGVMRAIAGGLGVRCDHCHVGGNPRTLEGVDFASDSLRAKRTARQMLRMVEAINGTHLRDVAPDSTTRLEVSCLTCHRGVERPEPLDRLVRRVAASDGLEAAVAEYRRLRERYHGSGAYDFGERTLLRASEGAPPEHAIRFLALNLEMHPRSALTHAELGRVFLIAGDTAAAIRHFDSAMVLRPEDRLLSERIRRLLPR